MTVITQTNPRDALVEGITRKQDLASLRAVARHLGVSHATLQLAISGDRPFGVPLLGALRRAYPDLGPLIDAYEIGEAPAQADAA